MRQIWILTSLTNPEQNHKGRLVAITPAPSQHLGQLPNILRKPWPNSLLSLLNTIDKKLTDANSEPDIRYITTHTSTLGTDQQPTVPGNKILNTPDRFFMRVFKCVYPVLKEVITLSFSTLMLSPLSFSFWEGPKWGMLRGSTFSLSHAAGDPSYQ